MFKALFTFFVTAFLTVSSFAGINTWDYGSERDAMTSKETKWAMTTSPTQAVLAFPYNRGRNEVDLYVRQSPKWGFDVIVRVEKGQLTCDYDLCQVLVRFDDEPARKWTMNKPADHSSTSFFFANSRAFLTKLKKSKVVRIELQFFQNGNHIFDFQTANLTW